MDQETKEETVNYSKEKTEKSNPKENLETVNKATLSDISYDKKLEETVEQIKLFEENMKKMMEVIDVVTFSSNLEKIKKYKEVTEITLKVMEDSVSFNILDPEISKHLNEIKEMYFEINQEVVDIPNVSIVSQAALINDVEIKMDETIRIQNEYFKTLERELIQKENEIRQLRAIIEEKKKKDTLMS